MGAHLTPFLVRRKPVPVYRLSPESIDALSEITFAAAGIKERGDLQRLLRSQIEVISPDTMVITEEFGDWDDSKRRIDLLGLDKDANLVVIELKRTEDGGHMELQAIRYAAMVSAMTFEQVVLTHQKFLDKVQIKEDAQDRILKHLGWDEPQEDEFAQDVRIVLASAEFSKEMTTAVMWLNERELDIMCMRLRPYKDGDGVLLDVQQIIPLPEASAYTIGVRAKQNSERKARKSQKDLTKYDVTINGNVIERLAKRQAILAVVRHLCNAGISPQDVAKQVPWREHNMFRSVNGAVTGDAFVDLATAEGPFDPTRFFLDADELIHFDGRTYAFTSQWGHRSYSAIKTLLAAYPDKQISCQPHPD
jgi:hypothetical protein